MMTKCLSYGIVSAAIPCNCCVMALDVQQYQRIKDVMPYRQ